MYLSGDPSGLRTAPQGAGRVSAHSLSGGDLGTKQTLDAMAAAAVDATGDYLTVLTARRIVSGCPERDTLCQALTIRRWLAERFRFIRDPLRKEVLRRPPDMVDEVERLGFVQGDCDEAATLGWALGESIGLRARFVVAGLNGDPAFRHTYAELDTRAGWVDLDTTAPKAAILPPVTREWVFQR